MSEVLCERGSPTRHAYFPIDGFISLTVLDRGGLEAAACSCYRADRQTYVERMR